MIKNIIFDIDGVLTDLDRCFFNFFKETYKEYANMSFEDLAIEFPMDPEDGAIELPSKFSADFGNSSYYCNRPLFEDTITVLNSLKKKGFKLFTLSAAANPIKKRKWLEEIFIDIFDELEFSPSKLPKDEALKEVLEKHRLNKEETVFVDDRVYNIRSGINIGVHTIRKRPRHSLPLPQDLSHIKSINSMTELEKYIDEITSKGSCH